MSSPNGGDRPAHSPGALVRQPTDPGAAKAPKVVYLRERVRALPLDDGTARAAFRLGLACACAAAAIAGVWLLGHLGFRLGAAPALGVPELLAEPGEGLATGAAALLRVPHAIHRLALHEPLAIVVAFAAIALPAAGLAAARPSRPGGPRPTAGVTALASIGAVLALAVTVTTVGWSLSPWRAALLAPLPARTLAIEEWATTVDRAAAIDMLALIVLTLWCVLVPRMPAPRWLRTLTMVLVLVGAGFAVVAAATSSATAAHAHLPRSVVRLETGGFGTLLGYTRGHTALLRDIDGVAMVVLVDHGERLLVVDRRSVAELGR